MEEFMKKSILLVAVILAFAVSANAQTTFRVFVQADSKGNNDRAARNQAMEIGKDLTRVCPEATVTIFQDKADFTILLNHIEHGLLFRDNQIQIYNKNGDLISGHEGGSIKGGVKGACAIMENEIKNPPNSQK